MSLAYHSASPFARATFGLWNEFPRCSRCRRLVYESFPGLYLTYYALSSDAAFLYGQTTSSSFLSIGGLFRLCFEKGLISTMQSFNSGHANDHETRPALRLFGSFYGRNIAELLRRE